MYVIEGLQPRETVFIQMSASNEVGEGPLSNNIETKSLKAGTFVNMLHFLNTDSNSVEHAKGIDKCLSLLHKIFRCACAGVGRVSHTKINDLSYRR